MKNFARKIIVTLILITIIAAAVSFTGCNQSLTEDEARTLLKDGVSAAVESEVYYVKYRINDTASENGKYVQYNLNVQNETAKFTEANGDIIKTVYDDTYYGKSLKSDVSSKNASESDYVTGMLTWKDAAWQIEACTFAEFLAKPEIAPYSIESVTDVIGSLNEEELEIKSATKMGKVIYITGKVNKEGNLLAKYDSVTIRIVNGKLAYIGDTKESFNISISYGGPKITVPVWKSVVENKGE